jgi:hypothetical protein
MRDNSIETLSRQSTRENFPIPGRSGAGCGSCGFLKLDGLKPSSLPESYDIVLCSLALHHFTNDDAVRVLQKIRELSRARVLLADLRRARWLSCAVYFVTATVYRDEMTKTDARLSAARAFSFVEMRKLAERAGWKHFRHRKFAVGWQAIWMDS